MITFFAAGAILVGILATWRPTATLVGVLLSLAVGLHWTLDDTLPWALLRWLAPGHKALVLAALIGCALRFGLRRAIVGWPLLAIGWLVVQTVWLAEPGPTPIRIGLAAFALAVPWLVPQVSLGEGARPALVHAVALAPLLSIALGFVLQSAGVHAVFAADRLQGATNPGWLGFLGYAGFAVCLHEAVRGWSRPHAALAAANLGIAILTAGRMAVFACIVHGLVYAVLSPQIGRRLGRAGLAAVVACAVLGAVAIFYLPIMQARLIEPGGEGLNMSGRDELVVAYVDQFLVGPVFGNGLGAASFAWNYFDLPHNEYLRLLVEGGVVGFAVFAGAVLLWLRRLRRLVPAADRAFVDALLASFAIYALTDNVLIMPPGLMAFVLLGVVLAPPAPARADAVQAGLESSTGTPRSTS